MDVANEGTRLSSDEQDFWQRLLAAESHPQKAWAVFDSLRAPERNGGAVVASRILSATERDRAAKASVAPLRSFFSHNAGILGPADLPEIYLESKNLPPALFYRGDTECLSRPLVAIVGTRAASTYGKAAAQKFSEALARSGATIVSGGALGIDAAAHRGALSVGGKTVAVLLTDIERVYPRVHFGLFEQIKQNGCLLSQFAIGAVSTKDYRPLMRNQTVAGLCSALIVVEAPERSGALSTAAAANELGRHVFVVPANIDNVNFRGSHSLIRDGATLVDHPDQVLEILGLAGSSSPVPETPVSDIQRRILAALGSNPVTTEFIVTKSELDTSVVLSELTILELEGRIFKDRGGYAIRL